VPVRRRYKTGRPTKRTKEVVKVLFDAIKEGVPYKLACMAAGITYDCFCRWRNNDPDFDRQVEKLVAKPAIDLFKVIRDQAPETWQAGAWALERRFPEMFAKPESQLQLNVLAQAATINGGGAPHNVQMVVVSDLEFVSLKRHPAYVHRPALAREAEQVPPELDGTLERENGNIIVTSSSKARAKPERYSKIRAKAEALVEARRADAGNSGEQTEPSLLPYPGAKEKSVDRSSNGGIHDVSGLSDAVTPPPG
jgi:transposase